MDAIEVATRRGAALTRQLLTFSRRQAFNPTVVHIPERVEACRTMLESYIGGAIKLVPTIEPEIWTVKIDGNELELAIVNLVINARDAMPEGGVISITAENVTLSSKDTAANIEGDFVALRVSDTGTGIAPDVLLKVFDPFFTTKETDKGTGLGLSQVHGFAHQSGGTVTIESELGRGTTVTLFLLRAQETDSDAQSESKLETLGEGTVLVVEDNPDVAEVTVGMLEQIGYRVHAVRDAGAAMAAIDQDQFDLVVSDIVMPGTMDGLMLARAVRQCRPNLPVLLVTGYSHVASDAAEFPILRKPFDQTDLSRLAARLVAEAKQPADTNVVRLRDPKLRPGIKTNEK